MFYCWNTVSFALLLTLPPTDGSSQYVAAGSELTLCTCSQRAHSIVCLWCTGFRQTVYAVTIQICRQRVNHGKYKSMEGLCLYWFLSMIFVHTQKHGVKLAFWPQKHVRMVFSGQKFGRLSLHSNSWLNPVISVSPGWLFLRFEKLRNFTQKSRFKCWTWHWMQCVYSSAIELLALIFNNFSHGCLWGALSSLGINTFRATV